MTDNLFNLEQLDRAKKVMEMLAFGQDPFTENKLPNDTILNNIELARSFFFTAKVLSEIITNGMPKSRSRSSRMDKKPFVITDEQIRASISPVPQTITNFIININNVVQDDSMVKIKSVSVTSWLVEQGLMEKSVDPISQKALRLPTEKGNFMGITAEKRTSVNGDYTVALYSKEAQLFILENIDDILSYNYGKE
ncbi:MAG: hypothetical protein Q7J08_05895 [Methanocorpusculum sp.]|uniref:hypothetical protein n=1 Tax=Methanocorpusculum sp. TaxID=2058474 RepID=UPI002728262E|nr:hypothetical protein [Methanocorpusculum sp.]MDO9523229.1 hypothetical protein [Methanocorpusculum sp.]